MYVDQKIDFNHEPIWEKQEGETTHAFGRFREYLTEKMGGGSYRSLVDRLGKTKGYRNVLEQWATKYRWAERVDAYVRYLAKEEDEGRVKARREMAERQAKSGILLQQKGIQAILSVPDKLEPETAVRFIEVGAKLERAALGGDEINVNMSGKLQQTQDKEEFDPARLTGEEYEAYKKLVKKGTV